MNVAILIPTLGRACALEPLLENIRATTPEGVHHVLFVLDHDDRASQEKLCLIGPDVIPPADDFHVVINDGSYPTKTNAGAEKAARYAALRWHGDSLVLPTADDVVFYPGWYEAALKHFEDGACVVGTSDLTPATAGGALATMPIVRRSYIEDPGAAYGEPGVLFHEGYHHNAVDRELWELAQHRGVAVFEPESVIEHRHPSWGTREADETDRKGNQQHQEADRALFEERQARWLA